MKKQLVRGFGGESFRANLILLQLEDLPYHRELRYPKPKKAMPPVVQVISRHDLYSSLRTRTLVAYSSGMKNINVNPFILKLVTL